MSQFWHAHWAEDSFIPSRLQNWEIPRWHAEKPNRHCITTKCIAYLNGRIYPTHKPKCKPPWSSFKGTWELPLKIDRCTAEKLSKFTEYSKIFWNNQKKLHDTLCKKRSTIKSIGNCNKNKSKTKFKRKSDNQILDFQIDNTDDKTQSKNIDNNIKISEDEKCKHIIKCII